MASSFINQLLGNSRVLVDVSLIPSFFCEKLIRANIKPAYKMQSTLSKMLIPKD